MIEREGSEYQKYETFTIEYRDASHRYWITSPVWDDEAEAYVDERVAVPSVTTILKVLDKPALNTWRVNQALSGVHPDDAAKEGADRGTAVHAVLEQWGKDQSVPSLYDFDVEVQGYVQGLCGWLLAVNPEPLSMERIVGSLEHGYAGRLDMRARIDGRDLICDLKTSKSSRIYAEAHAQARDYAIADVECGSPEPDGVVIVGVGADGSFTQVECEATAGDWLAILRCYKTMKQLQATVEAAA
jgi:hypothetical protein